MATPTRVRDAMHEHACMHTRDVAGWVGVCCACVRVCVCVYMCVSHACAYVMVTGINAVVCHQRACHSDSSGCVGQQLWYVDVHGAGACAHACTYSECVSCMNDVANMMIACHVCCQVLPSPSSSVLPSYVNRTTSPPSSTSTSSLLSSPCSLCCSISHHNHPHIHPTRHNSYRHRPDKANHSQQACGCC